MVCLLRGYGNGATWRGKLIVNQIIIVRIDNVGNVVILLFRNGPGHLPHPSVAARDAGYADFFFFFPYLRSLSQAALRA